ncbi:hypothetical protein CRYUN_Cryun35bG0046600 [Craigia yunnanensis]
MTFLVNVYAKCDAMENARKVFISLPGKNVVAWTTLMTGYVHNDQPDVAISVFQEMLEFGLDSAIKAFQKIGEKNVISWTTVISACGDNSRAAKGLRFFTEMLADNVEPNEFTLTSVLSMPCTVLSLSIGARVHCLSIKLGYEPNLRIKNSIMYLYLKCGLFSEAYQLFNGMEDMGLVTMNSMIAGYGEMMALAKNDLSAYRSGTEALNIFSKLSNSGFKPDLYTFSSILTVCSKLVALEQGEQIYAQILKTGYLSEVVVGTALVNMYNKCGNIERASKAFLEMSSRTLISWTSMITAFAQNGQSQQALQLFEDTRLIGVRQNQITFVGVLSACGHAGMDANELLKLKPNDAETYVLLLTMYKSAQRWEDVTKVRELMREKKLEKLMDWSWISTKEKVYSFKPDERKILWG